MFEVLLLLYLGVSFAIRLAQYLLTCLSPYRAFRNINTSFNKHLEKAPFVSIHLPVCNEPPEVIIETIKSLLQIDYNHYEIIVLDNNTSDESLWKPVERFCGDKEGIRFFHVPKLEGNKAGALNRCIKHMDAQSEYILVVDADYIVKPEILDVCVNIAEDQKTDLLQFPQSYRNTSRTSTLNLEYSSYFKVFMNMANWLRCVLSTGTLSFIRCGALRQIGGWDGGTLTEDAELGVRLLGSGCKTLYVDEELGHGLTPFDYSSLDKQRKRWVTGNMQVLRAYIPALMKSTVLKVRQKAGIFLQLTAWVDFKVVALLMFSLAHMSGLSQKVISGFWLYFLSMVLLRVLMYKNTFGDISLGKALKILAINQSLIISSGLSWLKAFLPLKLEFEVTRKKRTRNPANVYLESNLTGLLFCSLTVLFSLSQHLISAILIAGVLMLHIWSRLYTKNYFKELNSNYVCT